MGSAENKAAVAAAGAIPLLAAVLRSSVPEARNQAIGVLRNLSGGSQENKSAVFSAGCVAPLAAVLQKRAECPPDALMNLCVVLYNLTNADAERRSAVADAGVIEPLVALLRDGALEVRREAADTLRALSIANPRN